MFSSTNRKVEVPGSSRNGDIVKKDYFMKINHVREAEKSWTNKAPMRKIFKNKDFFTTN